MARGEPIHMTTISNREPMRSFLERQHPPRFKVGDRIGEAKIEQVDWYNGTWYYKLNDGKNLVGSIKLLKEENLNEHEEAKSQEPSKNAD